MFNGKSFVGKSFSDHGLPGHFFDALRRDAAFIWNVLISAVFVAFAALAVASAVLDLVAIRH